ncbi:hypothetical protein [Fusobacterium varium]|uniref:hypothetical protein n=1 Tax=Fusobacterium varium TaxID=856 RepID=UPI00356175E9
MKCRGKETRERIVAEYDVTPTLHMALLNGQTKYSDAEAELEKEYYIFTAVRKSDGKKETIQCGMGAARHFLELLNHPSIPLFNPLYEVTNNNDTIERKQNDSYQGGSKVSWNPVAKQLYNAVMLLFTFWSVKPDTVLFEVGEKVMRYKNYEPYDSQIKKVNTAIRNGCKGKKTLRDLINEHKENNIFKEEMSDFSLLEKRIEKINEQIKEEDKEKAEKRPLIISFF